VAVTNTVAGQVTRFYRDADGNLVKKSDGAGTVMIVGTHFEHITATNQSTSYYVLGSQRVAMRTSGAVYWLHGDHLGSASLTTDVSGQKVAELRYLPFGETRWMSGTTPTDRRYIGQREVPAIGLYDYNARMYWPAAGRFVSADTVADGLNRYLYVRGNSLRYTDPTGHLTDDEIKTLLGNDYQYLWDLWQTYDPYWITILENTQLTESIGASLMEGALHFEGTGANLRAVQYIGNRKVQTSLYQWQGKGVYTVYADGASEEATAMRRDAYFNETFGPGLGLSPAFEYRRGRDGDLHHRYLGAVQMFQTVAFKPTLLTDWALENVFGDMAVPVGLAADAFLGFIKDVQDAGKAGAVSSGLGTLVKGLAVMAVDLALGTIVAGYTGPRTYYTDPVPNSQVPLEVFGP
jgi:RHS repeat-associated protein